MDEDLFKLENKNDAILLLTPDENTKYVTFPHDAKELDLLVEQETNPDLKDELLERCEVCCLFLQEPFIKCAECGALICLNCFATGRETIVHQNNHSYTVVRDDIQIFTTKDMVCWTAADEKKLLKAIQKHGYGNWEDIAMELKDKFGKDQCRDHYHECYFGGIFLEKLGLANHLETRFPEPRPYLVKMRSIDPPRHDKITSVQYEIMAGYRCGRGEFDTPYDNSAESILSTIMDFEKIEQDHHHSTESRLIEEDLKCALVSAYNHRLRERYRRYKIMRDHGLIMINKTIQWFTQYMEALGNKANSSRFLVFMQISKPEKFEFLMESLKYFKETEKSIYKMYELRENGLRTLKGGSLYFKSKKMRLEQQKERSKQEDKIWHDWRKLIKLSGEFKNPFHISHTGNPCPRKKPGPLDITGLPGYSNLSKDERELCKNARLIPQNFLEYKKNLIAENTKIGHLRLNDARRLIKIDVNKTRLIYDFLIENGHIKKPHSVP